MAVSWSTPSFWRSQNLRIGLCLFLHWAYVVASRSFAYSFALAGTVHRNGAYPSTGDGTFMTGVITQALTAETDWYDSRGIQQTRARFITFNLRLKIMLHKNGVRANRLKTVGREESGSSLIEFALTLPVLLLVVTWYGHVRRGYEQLSAVDRGDQRWSASVGDQPAADERSLFGGVYGGSSCCPHHEPPRT